LAKKTLAFAGTSGIAGISTGVVVAAWASCPASLVSVALSSLLLHAIKDAATIAVVNKYFINVPF
jgi:hypothetical protein